MGWRAAARPWGHAAAPHRAAERGCAGGSRGGQRRAAERGLCRAALGLRVEGLSHAGVHGPRPATARPQEQTRGSHSSKGSTERVPPSGPARCQHLSRSTWQQPAQQGVHLTAACTGWRLPAPTRAQPQGRGPQPPAWCRGSPTHQGPPKSLPPAPRPFSGHSQSSTSGPRPCSSCKSSSAKPGGALAPGSPSYL